MKNKLLIVKASFLLAFGCNNDKNHSETELIKRAHEIHNKVLTLDTHADTPLSEGRLRSYNLTCPLHGTSFDVRTGEHSGPPAYEGVPCFKVNVENGTAVALPLGGESGDDDDFGGIGGIFQTR